MGDILFLAHRAPFPPDRGDKIRSFNILKHLARHHRVHLIAFADDKRDLTRQDAVAHLTASRTIVWRGKPRGRAMMEALTGGKPVSLTAFDDRQMRDAIRSTLAAHPIDTIYVFSGQMAQYLPPDMTARVIMDFVDMDSAKFESYADAAGWPVSWMMRREARLLFAFEQAVAARADASLFVSEAEAALFRDRSGAANVLAVENGIDTDRYDPFARFDAVSEAAPLIVFTGQMDYRPNAEAVAWFVRDILPAIRARHRQARFAIVGRNAGDEVRALAGDAVIVTGEVPDVRGWIAAASVVAAPLRIARGVQNKVLEAMAMARPVVASAAAAEGIDHGDAIRVGASALEIAAEVSALIEHPGVAAELGQAARARVKARYGWDARLAPLDALLGDLPAPAPAAREIAA